MRMEFLGAAHEVTGSQTLLTVNDRPFLVDCGMEQGANRFENKPLPVRPEALLCVLVTHAHIDHSGNLPLLYKRGFRGPIYATEETCNLLQIMLRDSATYRSRTRNGRRARPSAPAALPWSRSTTSKTPRARSAFCAPAAMASACPCSKAWRYALRTSAI